MYSSIPSKVTEPILHWGVALEASNLIGYFGLLQARFGFFNFSGDISPNNCGAVWQIEEPHLTYFRGKR